MHSQETIIGRQTIERFLKALKNGASSREGWNWKIPARTHDGKHP
ncbi:MAG: hypothetical protein ACU83V_11835 [Gammaproteobacteria bacterium]